MKHYSKCVAIVSFVAMLTSLGSAPEVAPAPSISIPEVHLVQPVAAAPTPAPVPEPPTPEPAPPRSPCDYINDYDWDKRVMRAIAMAESGCKPQRGDGHLTFTQNGRTYGYSLGVLQVRILPGRERCDTTDPAVLVDCAYGVYKSQGFSAWTMYNNSRYRNFL